MPYITTVRLHDELAESLKTYCARTGATVNGALVVAVERLVGAPAGENPFLPGEYRERADGLAGRDPAASEEEAPRGDCS